MANILATRSRVFTHFHLFCGIGGGALGFNAGQARVGRATATGQCVGGVDSDPGAIEAFTRHTGAKGTVLDLFSREQYTAFHGREPGADWREATADDLRQAAHGVFPDIVFTSPPCKGFSGLLNRRSARSDKYRALNELTLRGIALMLEAFADDPPSLVILENVPRIQTRGRDLLDAIQTVLRVHGYAVAETTHNCGEIGGLAQNRNRFLLVARHRAKVPPHLYEPGRRPMQTIGDVISSLPVPVPGARGLHRLPALNWKTWLRLALIKPGHDWRWLESYDYADGVLQGYDLQRAQAHALADVRLNAHTSSRTGRRNEYGQYGVNTMGEQVGTVTGKGIGNPGAGRYSIADDRPFSEHARAKYHVADMANGSRTVIAESATGNGAHSIADMRLRRKAFLNVWRVCAWSHGATQAITSGTGPTAGGQAIGDVRIGLNRSSGHTQSGQAHYGVMPLDAHTRAVTGHAKWDNGPFSVADQVPALNEKCQPLIVTTWGTWNRPFTTLELAALQGYDTERIIAAINGATDTKAREWIGNSVPPTAAAAVASEFYETLLLAEAGVTFQLSAKPIWVAPLATALSIATA